MRGGVWMQTSNFEISIVIKAGMRRQGAAKESAKARADARRFNLGCAVASEVKRRERNR